MAMAKCDAQTGCGQGSSGASPPTAAGERFRRYGVIPFDGVSELRHTPSDRYSHRRLRKNPYMASAISTISAIECQNPSRVPVPGKSTFMP